VLSQSVLRVAVVSSASWVWNKQHRRARLRLRLLFDTLDGCRRWQYHILLLMDQRCSTATAPPLLHDERYRVLQHVSSLPASVHGRGAAIWYIDWAHGFNCYMATRRRAVTGRVVVSTLVRKIRLIVKPWAADHQSGRLLFGSAFRVRVMVPTAPLRKQLRAYARRRE
jgi:hypothetical protein